jgi:hypothetical protein
VLGNSIPHYHDYYEIFLVVEGPLLHHINGECETLYPDTMVFVRPEDQRFFARKDKGTVQFFNLAFAEDQFVRAKELAAKCTPEIRDLPLMDQVVLPHELSRLLLRLMKWLQDVSNPIPHEVQLTEGITLLTDILVLLRQYKLEPKRIRFVQPYADKEPTMVLVEAARGGKPWVKVDAPLVIYKAPNEYTEEIYEIYYGKGQA